MIQIIYNREVLDNGDFVTSADITTDNTLPENITFTVDNKIIELRDKKINNENAHFDFETIPELCTLSFDREKFINRLSLPQIVMHGAGKDTDIHVKFKCDPYMNEFEQDIFQTDEIELSYSLYASPYASPNSEKKRPLVLFLHGSGERGFDNQMPLLANDVPKTLYEYAKNKEDAVILVPQATWAPTLNGWFRKEFRKALLTLLDSIVEKFNIDKNRIYLSGLSNGASTTWYMGAKHSDIFAALVPCSGYVYDDNKEAFGEQGKGRYMLVTNDEAKALSKLPIWTFHAEDDPTVGILGTKKVKEAIANIGGNKLKVTIYPKGTVTPNPHASWAFAYNNPELLPWLFDQHK